MADETSADAHYEIPRVPASAGALIFDQRGRLLILKPSYKKGWTIPGGQIDAGGESPWEACRRETREECGLEVVTGRLVCVDFRRPKPPRVREDGTERERPGGVRFLFDCGAFSGEQLAGIKLEDGEIADYRLAALPDAAACLRGPIRRRVMAAVGAKRCVYLEDGRAVQGVGARRCG